MSQVAAVISFSNGTRDNETPQCTVTVGQLTMTNDKGTPVEELRIHFISFFVYRCYVLRLRLTNSADVIGSQAK